MGSIRERAGWRDTSGTPVTEQTILNGNFIVANDNHADEGFALAA